MKTYAGERTIDGIKVSVDGQPLPARQDIRMLGRNGFEWSYEGPEPNQLALALLADHLGDPARALALHDRFMHEIVANFDNDWQMSAADIDAVLAAWGEQPQATA